MCGNLKQNQAFEGGSVLGSID